jgi:hypothetical protein
VRSSLVEAGVNHDVHAGLLDDLMARVAPCFARPGRETRLTCRRMVNGLLSELDDCNCWTLAEAAGLASPCPMQEAAGDWAVGQLNGEHSGDRGDAILIVTPAVSRPLRRPGDAARPTTSRRRSRHAIFGLIPVTAPELLRQLRGTVIPWPHRDHEHCETWSLWWRHHQYRAPGPPTLACLRRRGAIAVTNYIAAVTVRLETLNSSQR